MSGLGFFVACTALYYLAARSEITRPLWSHYRGFLDRLARCPACSGFWIGPALAWYVRPWYVGAGRWWEILGWGAAWGLVLTPIGTVIIKLALAYSYVAEEQEEDGHAPNKV